MRRRGRMRREGTDVSDVHEPDKQLQRIEKTSAALPCFSAGSLQAKGEKARSLAREISLVVRFSEQFFALCLMTRPANRMWAKTKFGGITMSGMKLTASGLGLPLFLARTAFLVAAGW